MDFWQFNLRHLRALAAIVKLGTISAAAKSVNISQPALTQALVRLESLFGQPLFDRIHGGIAPRPIAIILAERVELAFSHMPSKRVTMAELRATLALADHGGYTAASLETGLAQPSLHRAMHNLAIATGRPLVERRGRGIAFTGHGRLMVRMFRLVRAELLTALDEIAREDGREVGRITVGVMPLARARLLPTTISRFRRAHPGVDIVVIEGSHAELIEPLRDGSIDLLVGALRDTPSGGDVVQQPLFVDRPAVVARANHPLASSKLVQFEELATYPWIIAASGTPIRDRWQAMFANAGIAAPHVPIECGSVMIIRGVLLDSDFLTLLSPDQIAAEIAAGWLTIIADPPAALERTIGVTARASWHPSAPHREFIDIMAHSASE